MVSLRAWLELWGLPGWARLPVVCGFDSGSVRRGGPVPVGQKALPFYFVWSCAALERLCFALMEVGNSDTRASLTQAESCLSVSHVDLPLITGMLCSEFYKNSPSLERGRGRKYCLSKICRHQGGTQHLGSTDTHSLPQMLLAPGWMPVVVGHLLPSHFSFPWRKRSLSSTFLR